MFSTPGAALIRVAAYPDGLVLPAWPDLTSPRPVQWRRWLATVWAVPGFAAAVAGATPRLAAQIGRVVAGEPVSVERLRRLVESTVRYLLRWTTRATPFGTFAGVAPVEFGDRAAVRWGEAHRSVASANGQAIAEHTVRAERDLTVLRRVAVVTNAVGYRRGGVWVLPCARSDAERRWDIEVRLTDVVRAAVEGAAGPVGFGVLAARVAESLCLGVDEVERTVASLVRAGVLLSAVRPAMTVTDPAAHLACHLPMPDPGDRVAVDLRVDVAVTLPPAVRREAARAALTLVAVAPQLPGWAEYHRAFIARWGPGAAVPVRDVLTVLGFPAGYRGSTRRVPAVLTARDRLLGQVAQQSALTGGAEVVLGDELIGQLRADDERPPVPHTEVRFTLAAATLADVDRGAFTMTVLSGARHAGVSAGRFLHLLTPAERASFQHVYQNLPTALPDADIVQLSGPPLDARLISVARTPAMLPVLPVGDFHPDPPVTVADLAVAGDGHRLWLVRAATGRPVEALLCNSVLLPGLQQPLMRFLTEIWTAWTAPCSRFDWGHAGGLPFLPRVRRGRSILHPARWIVDRTALPRDVPWPQWRDAWQRYRDRHRLPEQILVGDDDVQLRLNLDDDAHLAVLWQQIDRRHHTTVTEAPGSAGWIGGRPAELLLTLTRTHPQPAGRPPRPARAATTVAHRPGPSPWLETRLYGRADDVLHDLAGRVDSLLPAGWWFLRYPDPEPHLRLRIPLHHADFTSTARSLAEWTQHLEHDGVLHDYTLHSYRPENRHGTGPTLAAAERVFAADSHTVLGRLAGDRQATTAAGMIAIANSFTHDGPRWLAAHLPHHRGPRLPPAQLAHARTPLRDDALDAALATYRRLAAADGLHLDHVLADLLHLHHARMIGVDTASERHCLRLARTIARTHQATA